MCCLSVIVSELMSFPDIQDVSRCNLCLIISSPLWVSSAVAGHWFSNAHFLSETFPQCYFFSASRCRIINPFDQYTEITSSATHEPRRDVRKQMLPALYWLIIIRDYFCTQEPCLSWPILWSEREMRFWVAFARKFRMTSQQEENPHQCKLSFW